MVTLSRKSKIYGVQIGARALEKVTETYIDPMFPLGTTGAPHEKVSTWVNLAGGLAAPLIAEKMRLDVEMAQVFGGHLFSNIVDYGMVYGAGLLPPATGSAVRRTFQPPMSPTNVAPRQQSYYPTSGAGISDVAIKNPIQNGGRYARS